MPFDTFVSLLVLAFASAFTPGPNNALVASSGATFGLRRTMPQILGITVGFPLMAFIVGLFLGQLFQASALLREALRWGGAAMLLYVAWKIASSGGLGSDTANPRPFTFLQAAAFQWINPKGWVMAIAAASQVVTVEHPVLTSLIIAAVFVAAGISSTIAWALVGQALRSWLADARWLRLFNVVMGATIALGAVVLFIE